MKILQLCHKPPLPSIDGGCIAIHNITEGLLNSGQDVKVITIETPKHPVKTEAFPLDYLRATHFESVFVDTTPKIKDALKSFCQGRSYQISRFFSKSMTSKLKQILENETFDIVHIESIYMAHYIDTIRKYSNAKIVLRLHNIEHQIWEQLADNESWPIQKMLYKSIARRIEKFEEKVLLNVDGYMTISDPDYQYFHQIFPNVYGIVIPFGIDLDHYPSEEDHIPSENPSLFHIGSMNWSPNIEGIEWFLDDIWPEILKVHPILSFTIAGHAIPDKLFLRKDHNVHIVGEVPDVCDFMADHDIMIVPLLSGSGIRIKIVEAMALGKVVITTSVGAEGLAVESGKHLFIADTPEQFVSAVSKCIATPDLCTIIGENARNYISISHNNELITNKILHFYQSIINKNA